jgi:arylsulfatase A-like enzyme
VPGKLDGISIVPTLLGKPQDLSQRLLYWEFHEGGFKQAVRWKNWKAVRLAPDRPLELYDLNADIGETRDVAAQHPEVVSKIETYLRTARTESRHWPGRTTSAEPSGTGEAKSAVRKP